MTQKFDIEETGFRLDRYEILNWGTFDKKIWVLEPGGKTTLLTGKNGSGKSTLVDGLLTLLVPNSNSRNYNQAAGGEQRKERSEWSYVQGAYAQSGDLDTGGKPQALKLRPDNTYSVLLAVFTNIPKQKIITLAQVLYMVEGRSDKFHVVSTQRLSISEHFQLSGNTTIKSLKAALKKKPGIEVSDTFKEYSSQLRKLFSLRSEKALNLFNQIVSIKEIGDLNDFVRKHMLEADDVRTSIDTLRGNYHDLTAAYEAIVKAEKQLQILQPIVKESQNYQQYSERIEALDHRLHILPHFIDALTISLLESAIQEAETRYIEESERGQQVEVQLERGRQKEQDLYASIQNDSVMRRIQELDREIRHAQERKTEKQRQAQNYQQIARRLRLETVLSPSQFTENQKLANERQQTLKEDVTRTRENQNQLNLEEYRLKGVIDERTEEIEQLKQRKTQIPTNELRLRKMISEGLRIEEDEFPFIGELLQVRDEAYDWQPAIERLLNGFARQMLVPETYYTKVRQWVEKTHLGGRLIYHRIQRQPEYVSDSNLREDSLFHKIRVHPDTSFANWLKDRLIRDYDYVCCRDQSQIDHEERAVTIMGQIKHGNNRYEKDDRRVLNDPRNYVLGWNNQEKIDALVQTLQENTNALKIVQTDLKNAQQEESDLRQQERSIEQLLAFVEFERLDVQAENQLLSQYEQEKKSLETSSNAFKTLQEQHAQTVTENGNLEKTLRQINAIITTSKNDLDRYRNRFQQCNKRLQAVDQEALRPDFSRIYEDLSNEPTLDNLDELRRSIEETYQGSRNSLMGTLTRTRQNIEKIMKEYGKAYPDETDDVDSDVAARDWYLKKVQDLERDDLPKYKDDFNEMLNRNIRQSITIFSEQLKKREDEIRKNIDQLNESLSQIAYTSTTYIKLLSKPTQQIEITGFKQLLRDTFPNIGEDEDTANRKVFGYIKTLIERFEKDPRWTTLVTDVRNWLDFSAEERYMSDHTVHERYQSSSGKSGGQKAKLAYTILASAIAYQYGLNEVAQRDQTFRFVVIDEVFSKSDEANSRFAMDLFKHLGLQVLVVTPSDKIQIVEPYIGSCHVVGNNGAGTYSQVGTITIEQLRQYRQQEASA